MTQRLMMRDRSPTTPSPVAGSSCGGLLPPMGALALSPPPPASTTSAARVETSLEEQIMLSSLFDRLENSFHSTASLPAASGAASNVAGSVQPSGSRSRFDNLSPLNLDLSLLDNLSIRSEDQLSSPVSDLALMSSTSNKRKLRKRFGNKPTPTTTGGGSGGRNFGGGSSNSGSSAEISPVNMGPPASAQQQKQHQIMSSWTETVPLQPQNTRESVMGPLEAFFRSINSGSYAQHGNKAQQQQRRTVAEQPPKLINNRVMVKDNNGVVRTNDSPCVALGNANNKEHQHNNKRSGKVYGVAALARPQTSLNSGCGATSKKQTASSAAAGGGGSSADAVPTLMLLQPAANTVNMAAAAAAAVAATPPPLSDSAATEGGDVAQPSCSNNFSWTPSLLNQRRSPTTTTSTTAAASSNTTSNNHNKTNDLSNKPEKDGKCNSSSDH